MAYSENVILDFLGQLDRIENRKDPHYYQNLHDAIDEYHAKGWDVYAWFTVGELRSAGIEDVPESIDGCVEAFFRVQQKDEQKKFAMEIIAAEEARRIIESEETKKVELGLYLSRKD